MTTLQSLASIRSNLTTVQKPGRIMSDGVFVGAVVGIGIMAIGLAIYAMGLADWLSS